MGGMLPCECQVPEPIHSVAVRAMAPYTNECKCGGFFVPCGRCLEPLGNGKEHGLGKCHAPEPTDGAAAA